MSAQQETLIERLCQVESPRDIQNWETLQGHYVAACRASADDIPGLIEIVQKWTDEDWPSDRDLKRANRARRDRLQLLPVAAWRTLADLRAETAVQPLIDFLRKQDDDFDDWTSEEFPHVFGKIGPPAIAPLVQLARDKSATETARSIAVRGLRVVADNYSETRDRVAAHLTEMMVDATAEELEFNSTILVELVELGAVEAAEPIERAFAANLIDVGMMGDWEQVRRELGVQGLGLTMPDQPHNCMDQFRAAVGIGIFSKRAIFLTGEIDTDAERAYYDQADRMFSKSKEAREAIDEHGGQGWPQSLLEFGIQYRGETVDAMTLDSVREFVLEHLPRKFSTEPETAAAIIFELAKFWEYVDRVFQLPAARTIVDWLKSDGRVAQLQAELSNPANFGMAKAFFALGKRAGFDMTSHAGLDAFTASYNRALQAEHVPPPPARLPVSQKTRVGRNDPCPCGSGKKHKKCCGGPHQRTTAR